MITRWESQTNKTPETYAKSLQSLLSSSCDLFKLKIPSSIKKVLFIGAAIINLSKQARFVFGKSITQPLAILSRVFTIWFKKFNFRFWFILRTFYLLSQWTLQHNIDGEMKSRSQWKFVFFFIHRKCESFGFRKIWTFSELSFTTQVERWVDERRKQKRFFFQQFEFW